MTGTGSALRTSSGGMIMAGITPSSVTAASAMTAEPNPSKNCGPDPYPPKVENIATATATPKAAPTWRTVLLTPEAVANRPGSTDLITAVAVVGKAVDTPMPATSNGTMSAT